jgi:hypothetical protein
VSLTPKNKWTYGNSWDKYPIEEGEVWCDPASSSKIAVANLRGDLPDFIADIDLLYCGFPWNQGNVNSFITKAGMDKYIKSYDEFMDSLFSKISLINPKVCYLEIGKRHKCDFMEQLTKQFPIVQVWKITYNRKNPCYLLRGGQSPVTFDFSGMNDESTPYAAIKADHPHGVADLCIGRGLTLLAAHKLGAKFFGTELNKRILAAAIERAAMKGIHYEKCNVQ